MTDLRRLKVSLTKHGAHKVAALLMKYEPNDVLDHLSGSESGINIERAQAKKTLSVGSNDAIPALWHEAKLRGSETVSALVLIGIIFSHHTLISVMQNSASKRPFSGRIIRGRGIDGKAYTNFAHIIEELGYSTEHSFDHIEYHLHKLFQIKGLNELAGELFKLKLNEAGWARKNSLVDESIRLRFYDVFSLTKPQFLVWLTTGNLEGADTLPKDVHFFFNAEDNVPSSPFKFQPGHTNKKIGHVKIKSPLRETSAILLHNEIQNDLYKKLTARYGSECVRSELPTGQGTSIDLVVKTSSFCWFYEIKTADSVKACIRQALPQLLEYAYWHGQADRADRLIIVSTLSITHEAQRYLKFLRENFGLEIYYEQHNFTSE